MQTIGGHNFRKLVKRKITSFPSNEITNRNKLFHLYMLNNTIQNFTGKLALKSLPGANLPQASDHFRSEIEVCAVYGMVDLALAEYAPEGMSPIIYSAIYNGTYILPELTISLVIISILLKTRFLELYRISNSLFRYIESILF